MATERYRRQGLVGNSLAGNAPANAIHRWLGIAAHGPWVARLRPSNPDSWLLQKETEAPDSPRAEELWPFYHYHFL